MRIVSGSHKGRIIRPPGFFKARPTTDMSKESLFNILQNRLEFSSIDVLDLFAGTGSISYEFASRGCRKVIAVDSNFRYCKFITDTAKQFGFDQIQIIRADCFKFIEKNPEKFDLIFADPPYDLAKLKELPDIVISSNKLNSEGTFILEHPSNYDFSNHPNFSEQRSYSRVQFSFFSV